MASRVSGEAGGGKGRCVGCRVTMGHLRVIIGHIRVAICYLSVTVGQQGNIMQTQLSFTPKSVCDERKANKVFQDTLYVQLYI